MVVSQPIWSPDTLSLDEAFEQHADPRTLRVLVNYWWAYYIARDMSGPTLIADLGCHSGYGARILAEVPGAQVEGYDNSKLALAVADQDFSCEQITWHNLDFDTPFNKLLRSADVYVAFDLIEELRHRDMFLTDLGATQNPDSWVLFSLQDPLNATRTPLLPLQLLYSVEELASLLRRFYVTVVFSDVKTRINPKLPGGTFLQRINAEHDMFFGNDLIACSTPIR